MLSNARSSGPKVNKRVPALQRPCVVGLVPLCGELALCFVSLVILSCASGEFNTLCEKTEHNPSGLKAVRHVSPDSCIARIFLIIKDS